MFSQLRNYLFGVAENPRPKENDHADEDEWVVIDSQDLPSVQDISTTPAMEESWLMTTPELPTTIAVSASKRRRRSSQPKGTKPRRLRGRKVKSSLDEADSLSSSIAVIPSPEPRAATAAASSLWAAAVADNQQIAAITAARNAQKKSDKTFINRKSLLRSNRMIVAAAGGQHRRRFHIANRLCGSNNNRKC